MTAPYQTVGIDDARRMAHTAQRRRILSGSWDEDLRAYIGEYIDTQRQASWGRPVKSVNLMRSVVGQLSVLYDETPMLRHPETEDLSALEGIFKLHQRHEDYVLGFRESAIRVSWVPADDLGPAGVTVRLVTPDTLVIEAADARPGEPATIYELRERVNPDSGKVEPFWDVWDIASPNGPSFKVIKPGATPKDYTGHFSPEMVGAYPFVDPDGRPFLPFVLYHARDTGQIWDAYAWDELPEATLSLALYFTFFNHAVKDASWVQKYGVNVQLQGLTVAGEGDESRQRVSTDPASILLFRAVGGEAGSLGSFPLPVEPSKLIDAIRTYTAMIGETLGIGKWDAEQLGPQSGIALTIKRDAVREMTARTEPQFRRGDLELARKAALIHNLYAVGADRLPVDGYSITYTAIPKSREEMTTELDRDLKLIEAGLLSRVDMIQQMRPELSRAEAFALLVQIQKESQALADLATTPPTTTENAP